MQKGNKINVAVVFVTDIFFRPSFLALLCESPWKRHVFLSPCPFSLHFFWACRHLFPTT
jgi:hypothetical protein